MQANFNFHLTLTFPCSHISELVSRRTAVNLLRMRHTENIRLLLPNYHLNQESGEAETRRTRLCRGQGWYQLNVLPGVAGNVGICCFGNSPVNAFRKASISAISSLVRSLFNCSLPITLIA